MVRSTQRYFYNPSNPAALQPLQPRIMPDKHSNHLALQRKIHMSKLLIVTLLIPQETSLNIIRKISQEIQLYSTVTRSMTSLALYISNSLFWVWRLGSGGQLLDSTCRSRLETQEPKTNFHLKANHQKLVTRLVALVTTISMIYFYTFVHKVADTTRSRTTLISCDMIMTKPFFTECEAVIQINMPLVIYPVLFAVLEDTQRRKLLSKQLTGVCGNHGLFICLCFSCCLLSSYSVNVEIPAGLVIKILSQWRIINSSSIKG